MASDKTSPTAGTGTAHAGADSTQQLAPVSAPAPAGATDATAPAKGANGKPAANGTSKGAGASTNGTSKAAGATTTTTSAADAAEDSTTSGASVKDGAVKAAAAALAAARTAAKKVQSAASTASAGATPAPQQPTPQAAAAESAPRPEMHYSVGGVHGTAQAAPASGGYEDSPEPVEEPALGSPRRVRLSVSRIDPWSIMKLAFLLSVAIGIMTVVATIVVWYSLNSLGTFATIQEFMVETLGPQAVNLTQFVEFERMVSLATLIALVNIVLLTAIATIMAMLYNITAALVGGIHLTLTDE